MKYLSVGIAVAATAAAWAWWIHQRTPETEAAIPAPPGADRSTSAGIDDAMLHTPPNPDPAMVRVPSDPDPKMVRTLPSPEFPAANNGRKG